MRRGHHTAIGLIGGVLLAASMVIGGMGVSSATGDDGGNNADHRPEYWEAEFGVCVKDEHVSTPFVVPKHPEGARWTALIIKAGSMNQGLGLDPPIIDPVPGQAYGHSSGKDISFVILCHGPEESPTTSTTSSSTTSSSTTSSSTTSITVPPTTDSVPPTSITVPPTSITVPPTTDSVPPTSITVPPTSLTVPPTTDSVPSTAPAEVLRETTTILTSSGPRAEALAITGTSAAQVVTAALGMVLLGFALASGVARRRED
jgi:hypothetical protein